MLLTRSPLRQTQFLRTENASLDLHALGAPPAFILSQDQTLQRTHNDSPARARREVNEGFGLGPGVRENPELDCSSDCHLRPEAAGASPLMSAPSPPLRGDAALLAGCSA